MKSKILSLHRTFLAGIAAALVILVSCSTVPDSGRTQLNVFSTEQEAKMGFDQFSKLKQTKKLSTNSAYNAQAQRVGARVARVIPIKNPQWEFVVFDDPTPNAFALPGGKVGVHSGLFQITQSDAGLAAVMGHEIAHVYARHGGERMTAQLGAVAGTILLDQILKNNTSQGTRQVAVGGAAVASTLGVLSFSRSQETEADQLGALYMARAGYNPQEAVNVWKRFAAYKERQGGANVPQFLRTHPLDSTRIKNHEAYMPTAMAYKP